MIRVSKLTKCFGDHTAVDNLSFEVKEGEIVGFLGPNGAGKTTTMRMMTGGILPDSGSITIGGLSAVEDRLTVQRTIGYMPENNPLYRDMLVSDFLRFSGELYGMKAIDIRRNLNDVVPSTGIADVFYRPIRELSKGYKQRVGLATALLHKPKFLVLDEPTEGLDPNQRHGIRDLIRSLSETCTVILSTHVLQEVAAICDRILIINEGKLVADSTPEELQRGAEGEQSLLFVAQGEKLEPVVQGLPGVKKVEILPGDSDKTHMQISLHSGAKIQPALSQAARDQGWIIWHLAELEHTLEDVFKSLTDKNHE